MHNIKKYRNIGIMAHIDAGKTTTTERILFYTKKSHKIGEVHQGNTTMDWMPQEKERGITITSAATTCFWSNETIKNARINIIDTPGHVDFTGEVERSLRVLDGAIILFDGVSGVESQTENIWKQVNKYKIPRICFINKLDRIGSNFQRCIDMIKNKLDTKIITLQIPVGKEKNFLGVIDILEEKYIIWDEKLGVKFIIKNIPKDLKVLVKKRKNFLIENIIEQDDILMEKYLQKKNISINDIKKTIKNQVIRNKLIPIICGSAFKNKGIQLLLNAVLDYLPNPLEKENPYNIKKDQKLRAIAFKIMNDPFVGSITFIRIYTGKIKSGQYIYNSNKKKKERVSRIMLMHANNREEIKTCQEGDIVAISGLKYTLTGDTLCNIGDKIILEKIKFPAPVIEAAVEPKKNQDHEKMIIAIKKLISEDPSIKIKTDKETKQTKISGMGELHLEIIIDRLKREFQIDVNMGKPEVAYKETISGKHTIDYIHKKQTGGAGQFARVKICFEKAEKSSGNKFINKVTGGKIPKEYIPAIEKSIQQASKTGVLYGYPLVDFKTTLLDGTYHDVDSSSLAFEIAARNAFKEGIKKAIPILLEPIMKVEVTAPTEQLGSVLSHISRIRGKIISTKSYNNNQIIESRIPLSSMFGYVNKLRTITKGQGFYNMSFFNYKKVPKIIEEKLKKINY